MSECDRKPRYITYKPTQTCERTFDARAVTMKEWLYSPVFAVEVAATTYVGT